MKTTVLCNQSMLDISLVQTGSIASVFRIAALNNMSVTDDPIPGQTIETVDSVKNQVTEYYKEKNLAPATGNLEEAGLELRIFTDEFTKEFC